MNNMDKLEFDVNKKDGVAEIECKTKTAFVDTAEGVGKDELTAAFKHSGAYIAAVSEDAVDRSIDVFKKDKKISETKVTYPYGPTGSGKVTVHIDREKTWPGIGDRPAVTKPAVSVKVDHAQTKAPGKTARRRWEDKIKESI